MKGSHKTEKLSLRSVQAKMLNGLIMYNLDHAKNTLPVTDFIALLSWAMTVTKKGKLVARSFRDSLYPKNIASLQSGPLFSVSTLDRELHWFNALMLANVKRIGRYLQLASFFEAALVGEQSKSCFEILDIVESEFGHSIWLVESRIAALQYFEGVESQKNM